MLITHAVLVDHAGNEVCPRVPVPADGKDITLGPVETTCTAHVVFITKDGQKVMAETPHNLCAVSDTVVIGPPKLTSRP